MPRYYFDLIDSLERQRSDQIGTDFNTLSDAQHDALKMLHRIAGNHLADADEAKLTVEIRDQPGGRVLATVSLSAGED